MPMNLAVVLWKREPVRTGTLSASQLEKELDRTRERVQTIIEKYETSNEELKALRVAKQQAETANAAKVAFLVAMSHEFRTPLNAIMGYVDLMEMGVPDPPTDSQAAQIKRIGMSARHLLEFAEEILRFARLEAGHERINFQEVSLNDIIDEIRAVVEPLAAKKDLELRIATDGAPDTICTDARRLRQILLNLVGNAVKFTEEGRVEIRFASDGDEVVSIEVIDTGKGMSQETLDHIFEPFWQEDGSLRGEARGTGLGLTISRRYAEMLGASLSVRSAVGSGTAFTIQLPHHPPPRGGTPTRRRGARSSPKAARP